MDQKQTEIIEFSNIPDLKVPIWREPSKETFLALQPPKALPYVVAPMEAPADQVAAFVQQRLGVLQEMRTDMLKHFSKTNSTKCHFKTGDVAHLLGRPFMLRVNPLSTNKKTKRGTRTRANLRATMYGDISLIDLFVVHIGDYDQGRTAFLAFAQPVFARNIHSLLKQCMQRVFPDAPLPLAVKCRPMRDTWVRIDLERSIVWFSESLIPYPVNAVVFAYLNEAMKHFAPDISDEERDVLLEQGVPNWQEMKAILADPNNRFVL
ncbi:MAG: DUF45 domain-containing protein [Coriobacteriales bacterium]|jgi:hypothetical protein|nr:DUF45 domain-containing protein [Coriobacteriales bacterium]